MTFLPETSEYYLSPSILTISIIFLGRFPNLGFAALFRSAPSGVDPFLMMNPESHDTPNKVDLSRICLPHSISCSTSRLPILGHISYLFRVYRSRRLCGSEMKEVRVQALDGPSLLIFQMTNTSIGIIP
jgi:hypothetical protein